MSNGADVGENLRRAREMRGLSIDDLATMTRLRPSAIRAAEDGDLSMLGGEPYVRGHLRTLAAKLGIDDEVLVRIYMDNDDTGDDHAN
jgi:cytoskeleton protein RodZ